MQRALHANFGRLSISDSQSLLGCRVAMLIDAMMRTTASHDDLFWRFSASTLVGATYGFNPDSSSLGGVIALLRAFTDQITAALLPGAYLVEFLPWMLYLPAWMAKWKRDGIRAFHDADRLFESLLRDVEQRTV